MDDELVRILESERLQMEQIRQLDAEELEIEEVDQPSDDEERHPRGHGGGGDQLLDGFTFDRSLASLHSYLGEVDDTQGRLTFLDGGAILSLPLYSIEGVVLFPSATIPLRVVEQLPMAAIDKALTQVDAPCTIGVVGLLRSSNNGRPRFSAIGTTAEIQKFRRLDDGSLNVVARGQQRFRLRRCWIDVEGVPFAEIQIIQEDAPLRIPKAAFGKLAARSGFCRTNMLEAAAPYTLPSKLHVPEDSENDSESAMSISSDHSIPDTNTPPGSPVMCESLHASPSSDEGFLWRLPNKFPGSNQRPCREKIYEHNNVLFDQCGQSSSGRSPIEHSGNSNELGSFSIPSASFWPYWVYRMYDSYSLARRAADLWNQNIRSPSMDELAKKPDLLSFSIASRLPLSESSRQELLEIDGVSYRLQKEIELLKCYDLICCRSCLSVIAKRSNMLVMSSDGPLNAYVNPGGCVHEVITLNNTRGLALSGHPVKEYSWFPGYAWTIAHCATCEFHMGWRFTAMREKLLPKSFWGIRSSQVKDGTVS